MINPSFDVLQRLGRRVCQPLSLIFDPGRTIGFWRSLSLPYPQAGIRLIRQDDLTTFRTQMAALRTELTEAVRQFEAQYAELQSAARRRLGSLYNPADYPASLTGWFDMSWDFPSVELPEYLRQLSPQLYREEAARVSARFDEAIRLAEQAFTEELSQLIAHLTERLSGSDDGKPKIYRDSAVGNLREFFERYRHLSVCSSQQMEEQGGDRLFERAFEKRIEHSAKCRTTDLGAAARGGVDVTPLLRPVLEVPLVDEDRQQGPHGGVAGRVGQGGMDVGRRGLAAGVYDVHDLSLAAAQRVGRCAAHGC